MDIMHLIRTEDQRYWPTKQTFDSILYPLWLLLNQWGSSSKQVIAAINSAVIYTTDFCRVYKEDAFVILENLQFDEEDSVVHLQIPLENLYDILGKWEKLEKARPREIILEFDGKNVSMRSVG
jgi:hypothetical protein